MDEIEATAEEKLSAAMNDDEEIYMDRAARHEHFSKKNEIAVKDFMGDGPRAVGVFSQRWFYGDLLAWTFRCVMEKEHWELVNVFGYHYSKPIYCDVKTDYDKKVNCLIDGQIFIKKDSVKLLVTLDSRSNSTNYLQVEAPEEQQPIIDELVEGVINYFTDNNFYRGKKIGLNAGGIVFIEAGKRDWESVVLDSKIKREIRQNTVGFLKKLEVWQKYGIPAKRGIILAGSPGTGKTIVCKALATEAEGITCLFAESSGMTHEGYIHSLYEIAQDVSPCIIFIEDIDLIGQERMGEMYQSIPPLISLLNEMDGITEVNGCVTVATTNGLEMLDKALSERPSRFDRIIRIPHPADEIRAQLIEHLAKRIPINPKTKTYLAEKTAGFSPAQIQETLFSMVITGTEGTDENSTLELTPENVDTVLGIMEPRKSARAIGFNTGPYPCPINGGQ